MRKIGTCFVLLMTIILGFPYPVMADKSSELEALIKNSKQLNLKRYDQANKQSRFIISWLPIDTELTDLDIPRSVVKGFSDFGFHTAITDNYSISMFALGAVDFFLTSEISDRISFLTEMEFHPDPEENSLHFHIERVNLKYSFSDLLNIKVGRMHTPLGYWNQAYHHGTWLQTTVHRPQIYIWEDEGGILPVHSVGIELFGVKEFNTFDLEYYFNVVNGRGRTITEIQNVEDKNNSKAINILFGLKPYFAPKLNLGVNTYMDRIPSNPTDLTRSSEIDELILGGFITYFDDRIELITEVFNIRHNDKIFKKDFVSSGFYSQGGYRLDEFISYYRFDYLDYETGDPYFSHNKVDILKHTVGIRWDIFTWTALKFEYSFTNQKGNENEHSIIINSSFTF